MRDPNRTKPRLRKRVAAMKLVLQEWETAVEAFARERQKMDDAEAARRSDGYPAYARAVLAVLDAEEKCFKASRRLDKAMHKHSLSTRVAPVSEARARLADMVNGSA
jgi:hypothetical protein